MDSTFLVSTVQAGSSVQMWAIFSWHILNSLIPVSVTTTIMDHLLTATSSTTTHHVAESAFINMIMRSVRFSGPPSQHIRLQHKTFGVNSNEKLPYECASDESA